MALMPPQKPGRSKQDYATPRDFIMAVQRKFGPIECDLAAHESNHVVPFYISEKQDSLSYDWSVLAPGGILWLNPPFGSIAPWATKCVAETEKGAKILLLVPASIGANWFAEHVFPHAAVIALQGRLSFDGKNPFPKDCMLCAYGWPRGFSVWDWKKDLLP